MKSLTLESQSPFPFDFAITRIAVAQICQSVGFKSSQSSALSTITDVAVRYLQTLAAAATASANSTGRTDSNILDIVAALEHLHSNKGFSGGSNLNRSFSDSGPLLDIIKFVKYSDEIPFAKPLPPRSLEETWRCSSLGGKGGRNYIPRWLPAIPEMGGKEREGKELGFGWNGENGEACLDEVKMGVEERGVEMPRMRELPLKRGIVKFKIGELKSGGMGIGVDWRSRIRRGGKRVSVQLCSGNGIKDGNDKKILKKRKMSRPKNLLR